MRGLRTIVGCMAVLASFGCAQRDDRSDLSVCPDLLDVGVGSPEWEMAKRCERLTSARYSHANASPESTAAAAATFCQPILDRVVADKEDFIYREKLSERFRKDLIRIGSQTVIATRAGDCLTSTAFKNQMAAPIDPVMAESIDPTNPALSGDPYLEVLRQRKKSPNPP